jgi:hypothetical protein
MMAFLDYEKLVQIHGDHGFVVDGESAVAEVQLANAL